MKKLLLATATCLAFAGIANACGETTTTRICYLRNYDRTHLAKHPNQSVAAMRISLSPLAEDSYTFDLDVQFREDKDNWSWITEGGICVRYGPGMNCATFNGGCDVLVETKSHFYINRENPKTLYRHLEKFFSPSRCESDSLTAMGHGRMERASHGADGLFRC
jgi:hypothetical protein